MIRQKRNFSQDALEVGLVILTDPIGFILHFWKEETTIPVNRKDLPRRWRGKQVISLEQRLLWADGALYMLAADTLPDIARKSSQKVIARTARKAGKTLHFEAMYVQIAICYGGRKQAEGLFHAPSEVHMTQVTSRIDAKVDRTPIFKMLHRRRASDIGVDEWNTGYIWHRRIEGTSNTGRNMVGLRAKHVLGDEGDYSQQVAQEERQQTALPDAFWFWAGVPRPGVRSVFWKTAQHDHSWSCHSQTSENNNRGIFYDIRMNPLYHSKKAWALQIGNNSYDSDWVQTQVLGLDGGSGSSAFPTIAVHDYFFRFMAISDSDIEDEIALERFIDELFPADVLPFKPDDWMIHCDYGHSPSPMIIGISYLWNNIWYEYARISALRMHSPAAARLLNAIDAATPTLSRVIVMDPHGRGAGTYENLQQLEMYKPWNYRDRLISANFHTRLEDSRIMVHKKCNHIVSPVEDNPFIWECTFCRIMVFSEDVRPARVLAKELLSSELSEALARGKKMLEQPSQEDEYGIVLSRQDSELYNELFGTTIITTSGRGAATVTYVPPLGRDVDHNTDAWRCLIAGCRHLYADNNADIAEELDEFGWIR